MWVLGIIWCQPAVGPDQGTYRYAAVIVLRQHQTTISKPSHIIVCEWCSQFTAPTLGSDGRQIANPDIGSLAPLGPPRAGDETTARPRRVYGVAASSPVR